MNDEGSSLKRQKLSTPQQQQQQQPPWARMHHHHQHQQQHDDDSMEGHNNNNHDMNDNETYDVTQLTNEEKMRVIQQFSSLSTDEISELPSEVRESMETLVREWVATTTTTTEQDHHQQQQQ
mmetsp:Transcript_23995/g.23744  ORF Transcript_23995/g.23744 Transcript_23995/m.23744 type:complete len:122 (-) Transcript_23995:23-388(-)